MKSSGACGIKMGEYTAMSFGEVRFSWNITSSDPMIDIYKNRDSENFVSVSLKLSELKEIKKDSRIFREYRKNVSRIIVLHDKFRVILEGDKIAFESLIADRRRKGYKHPIMFKRSDLDKVVEIIERETKELN